MTLDTKTQTTKDTKGCIIQSFMKEYLLWGFTWTCCIQKYVDEMENNLKCRIVIGDWNQSMS